MPAKKTEASLLFLEGGQLLFETDNWLARYAGALGVPVTRIRDIRRGRADLNRDGVEGGLLKGALELAEHLNQGAGRTGSGTAPCGENCPGLRGPHAGY
jgi:hypothetical protein